MNNPYEIEQKSHFKCMCKIIPIECANMQEKGRYFNNGPSDESDS